MNRKSPSNKNLCFGFKEDKPKVNSKPLITKCGDSDDNVWQLWDDGRFVEKKSGLCMDLVGSGNGKKINLQKCNTKDKAQGWQSRTITKKFFQLQNTNNKLCLDLPYYDGNEGRVAQQWACSNKGPKDNMEYMWI